MDALCLAANTVNGRAFNFIVDGIRYWKFNRVVYAGAGEVPLELFNLVGSSKDALFANGFSFDHRAFTPHITLVRKVQPHVLPKSLKSLAEPIVWPVSEWILVKSEQVSDRSVYTPIGHWPLVSDSKINTAFKMLCQLFLADLGVILFKAVAYQNPHMAVQVAVNESYKGRRSN